jgi:hypothetical protein
MHTLHYFVLGAGEGRKIYCGNKINIIRRRIHSPPRKLREKKKQNFKRKITTPKLKQIKATL